MSSQCLTSNYKAVKTFAKAPSNECKCNTTLLIEARK